MTKNRDINFLIVLVSVFVIISLIGLSFYINKKADNLIASYTARKEDLQVRGAQLENAIVALNNTLNQEKLTEQQLANELATLKNQTTPTTPKPTPSPKPKPTPAPVTRAS
jgi:predicted PurR-regulated permease PerM